MFLIDADTLNFLLLQNPGVIENFEQFEDKIALSTISAMECFELHLNKNPVILKFFKALFESYKVIQFDLNDSLTFAKLKNQNPLIQNLSKDQEFMIAAQCLNRGYTLVTPNSNFDNINHLKTSNWVSEK